jgi:S1-C subfamily serine protease
MMKLQRPTIKLLIGVVPALVWLTVTINQTFAQSSLPIGDNVRDSIVTVLLAGDGEPLAVGSGVVVRSDGLILTAYHLVKDARGIGVRLRNGEVFDHAEVVATDERRNLAILRINATGLYPVQNAVLEEALVGSRVLIIANDQSEKGNTISDILTSGILTSVSLAEEIPGAGQGYRVLSFSAPVSLANSGALLLDERGRVLGILAARPQAQAQNYAVPVSSVIGLVRSIGLPASAAVTLASASAAPVPIPQTSVLVPQRPVLPLEARGPGSVVVKPSRPVDVLAASKTVYVTSRTEFFKPEHLINALRKRAEVEQWGLSFVDDPRVADLILTIDHVLFTYKFTFSVSHQRTGIIVATGNVIVFDGNLGGPWMADRVIEKLAAVRAQPATK